MAQHPNAKLVARGYKAFATGDLATLSELFAPDVVWHQPGKTPIAGDHNGRDRVFAFFGKLAEMTGGTYRVEPQDILADDHHAVAIQHSTARRDGRTLDAQEVLVFEVHDGTVSDIRLFAGDQLQEEGFWS